MKAVEREISSIPEAVAAELGGSYAKGTWLPQNADIDVFVRIDASADEKRFRQLGERIGFAALEGFGPYVRYSEHPYVEARVRGTKVNVVPCYDAKEGEWRSAADRSPFHTRFMRAGLDAAKRSEVRVLKQFLASGGLYGAELSRQGFSGYVSEVLVWSLGGFRQALEAFASDGGPGVIGKAARGFDTPVTIADPVDPNRNLAAAISPENISRLALRARSYLAGPSPSFFSRRRPRARPRLLQSAVTVEFSYSERGPDTMWGQAKSAAASLAAKLDEAGFEVVRHAAISAEDGRITLAFLLVSLRIPAMRVRRGPEAFSKDDCTRFAAKNRRRSRLMWARDGRVMSLEDREFSEAGGFLRHQLGPGLARSGVPKGLAADIRRGFRIRTGARTLTAAAGEELARLADTDEKDFSSRS